MYLPDQFKEVDPSEVAAIMAASPLACLVADTAQGLLANHIPITPDKKGVLIGHVALANDMHRLVEEGQDVLAVFRSVDSYISPNTYPSKQEHHRHVPTWNYQAVHVHGTISFQHDERHKRAALGLLTKVQEQRVNGESAWRMADAPAEYLTDMMGKIVAFAINVTRTIAKSKLSQNRDDRDLSGAVDGLRRANRHQMADKMAAKRGSPA